MSYLYAEYQVNKNQTLVIKAEGKTKEQILAEMRERYKGDIKEELIQYKSY